jgi:hypothetical protein
LRSSLKPINHKLRVFLAINANFEARFFSENIFSNHNIGPSSTFASPFRKLPGRPEPGPVRLQQEPQVVRLQRDHQQEQAVLRLRRQQQVEELQRQLHLRRFGLLRCAASDPSTRAIVVQQGGENLLLKSRR